MSTPTADLFEAAESLLTQMTRRHGCRMYMCFEGMRVPLPFADAEFDRLVTCHFYGHLLDDEL